MYVDIGLTTLFIQSLKVNKRWYKRVVSIPYSWNSWFWGGVALCFFFKLFSTFIERNFFAIFTLKISKSWIKKKRYIWLQLDSDPYLTFENRISKNFFFSNPQHCWISVMSIPIIIFGTVNLLKGVEWRLSVLEWDCGGSVRQAAAKKLREGTKCILALHIFWLYKDNILKVRQSIQ